MNVELSSIYLGIWPHYIGNPHTNERDLSAGMDRLPRACLTSLADLSLQLHTTSGVAEIYICNSLCLCRSLFRMLAQALLTKLAMPDSMPDSLCRSLNCANLVSKKRS